MIVGKRPDWFQDWDGECAAIVAAGPSVKQEEVDLLRDRIHVVAINESVRLCPWADALYSCDYKWWSYREGVKDFKGLKITQDDEAKMRFPELCKIQIKKTGNGSLIHDFQMDTYGVVGAGGNSGFQVLNLLAQWGVKAFALLGFDMRCFDGKIHWHGRHPDSGKYVLNNPAQAAFDRWISHMTTAAPKINALGIDVVNCSAQSALQCFPKMTVQQALDRWHL